MERGRRTGEADGWEGAKGSEEKGRGTEERKRKERKEKEKDWKAGTEIGI